MSRLHVGGWIACGLLLFGSSERARADYISMELGAAGPEYYAVLALSTAKTIQLNGPGFSDGNVGIASQSAVGLNGSAGPEIHGNLYLTSGASVNSTAQVTGTVFYNQNLSAANSAALNASKAFAALAPTQTFGTISGPLTIYGNAGVNVISISGLNLGPNTLTINGAQGSEFVINDSGQFSLNAGKIVLTGGVTNSDVVFNVTSGSDISTSHGLNDESTINGIVLAPTSNVNMSPGMINGELIAGGSDIQVVSGGSVNQQVIIVPSVPAPPSIVLLVIGITICVALRGLYSRRRQLATQTL